MALRIASTSRSRLDTPGTWPSRLWPAPTTAQTSRSSRDGSIMGGPRRLYIRELADACRHLRRRGVDAVEQSIDLLAADRIDLHLRALASSRRVRVLHRRIEGDRAATLTRSAGTPGGSTNGRPITCSANAISNSCRRVACA